MIPINVGSEELLERFYKAADSYGVNGMDQKNMDDGLAIMAGNLAAKPSKERGRH